ncbi:MAG: hypothetical protein EP297_03810 [Gammaproteobacteria bacterium]|nr:MAG: hypothetical protein EP297_03810 [Gammaproteobacteria bacterium]
MPLITLRTNQVVSDKTDLCHQLSATAAELLGKSEKYVMTLVQDQQAMSFAGNDAPTALVEVKSLGLPEDVTTSMSEKLCRKVTELVNIPGERIYIEFSNPPRHLWGWNSGTFG